MNFVKHSELAGKHAFLSPSNYHWIRYDDEKLATSYLNMLAVEKGTELHAFAESAIKNRITLADLEETLNMYVNDSIKENMTPEQGLWYSDNCFGTADAISFKRGVLRIHDLKTGATKANMDQLRIYAALFCLEYKKKPSSISIILSIYQNGAVEMEEADPIYIQELMDIIKHCDLIIDSLKAKE